MFRFKRCWLWSKKTNFTCSPLVVLQTVRHAVALIIVMGEVISSSLIILLFKSFFLFFILQLELRVVHSTIESSTLSSFRSNRTMYFVAGTSPCLFTVSPAFFHTHYLLFFYFLLCFFPYLFTKKTKHTLPVPNPTRLIIASTYQRALQSVALRRQPARDCLCNAHHRI